MKGQFIQALVVIRMDVDKPGPDSIKDNQFDVFVCAKNHVRVYRHSNGAMVLTLAEDHAVRRKARLWMDTGVEDAVRARVKKIAIREIKKGSGKRRIKGASQITTGTWLMHVFWSEGTSDSSIQEKGGYGEGVDLDRHTSKLSIDSPVDGFPVELNDRLIDEPWLMVTDPDDAGYIAIVRPPISRNGQKDGGCSKLMLNSEYIKKSLANLDS